MDSPDLDGSEFQPGKIHEPSVRSFWTNELQANNWVLDTLQHGYALPFHTSPISMHLRNNLSARQHEKFVREEVEKLQLQGVVEFVDVKPDIVSPLTVASNSKGKLRLCLDLSRTVNPLLTVQPVVLADLKQALQITEPGDWQAVYDLTSAYHHHHIKILLTHTKYLGAVFKKTDGSIQYFVYKFLPFGVSSAVHVMTKVMKPVSAYIANQGIRHTIYLDDGRVLANSQAQIAQDYATVVGILQRAGWFLAVKKSDTLDSTSQVKKYLGFLIDSQNMKVSIPVDKEQALRQEIQTLISRHGSRVPAKQMAAVLGQMISCAPALGRLPLIFARPAYSEMEGEVEKKGWKATVKVTLRIVNSLAAFLENLESFNGNPISHSDRSISLLSIIGPPSHHFTTKILPQHVMELPREVFVSDASNVAVCSYSLFDSEPFFFVGQLQQQQVTLSSGYRELLAVKLALQARLDTRGPWDQTTNVFWLTDSENLVVFLNKGSSKQPIQQLVLEIMTLAKQLRIVLFPIHLRREDPRIKMADAGSRVRDSDDWSLDSASFAYLQGMFGPFSIDLFADTSNAKAPQFYSDFLCPGSLGIDAFTHSWSGENAWICPPISQVLKVIRKLKLSKLTGLLIIPAWKAANYWAILFPKNKETPSFVQTTFEIKPTIVQNQRACSPLFGKVPYSFLVVVINSEK